MSKSKKQLAEHLYVTTHMTQQEIAETVNVTEATLSKWKKEGSWEELKGAQELTANRVISNIRLGIAKLSNEDVIIHAKTIAMLSNAIDKLKTQRLDVENYCDAGLEFIDFIAKSDKPLARKVAEIHKDFIQLKLENGN